MYLLSSEVDTTKKVQTYLHNRPKSEKKCNLGKATLFHNELKCGKIPFWLDNAMFVSKAKINIFWKNFEQSSSEGACCGVKKKSWKVDFSFWGN